MYLCTCLCVWLHQVSAVAHGVFGRDVGSSLQSEDALVVARGLQSVWAPLLRSTWNLSSPDQGAIPCSLRWKVNC